MSEVIRPDAAPG